MRLVTPVLATALCKSSRIRHSPNSGTVRRFSLWNVFPLMEPAVWGFGSRRLISQSFLGAKAPLDPRTPFLFFATGGLGLWLGAFGKVWLFRCQSGIRGLWLTAFDKSEFFRCQSRSSRPRRRRVEESFSALVKQGKLYFFKSSQTSRERRAFASGNSCLSNSPVQKLQNSAFAEFWDSMPVSCFTNALCQNCKKLRFLR